MEATLLNDAQAHNNKILHDFFMMDGEDTGKEYIKALNEMFGIMVKSEDFREFTDNHRSGIIYMYQELCELFLNLKDPSFVNQPQTI